MPKDWLAFYCVDPEGKFLPVSQWERRGQLLGLPANGRFKQSIYDPDKTRLITLNVDTGQVCYFEEE